MTGSLLTSLNQTVSPFSDFPNFGVLPLPGGSTFYLFGVIGARILLSQLSKESSSALYPPQFSKAVNYPLKA